MYKKTLTMLFYLLLVASFSVAGCSRVISAKQTTPNSPPTVTNEPTASNSSPQKRFATLFEPETEWVKLAKTDKFKYWQIPEENTKYAIYNELLLNGIDPLQLMGGQLCFKEGIHMVPAVLSSTYKVSGSKIQIGKDEFVQIGEKFEFDNGVNKGNVSEIGMYSPEEKFPKEFINSPCFEGKKFTGGSIDIFYDSSSD